MRYCLGKFLQAVLCPPRFRAAIYFKFGPQSEEGVTAWAVKKTNIWSTTPTDRIG